MTEFEQKLLGIFKETVASSQFTDIAPHLRLLLGGSTAQGRDGNDLDFFVSVHVPHGCYADESFHRQAFSINYKKAFLRRFHDKLAKEKNITIQSVDEKYAQIKCEYEGTSVDITIDGFKPVMHSSFQVLKDVESGALVFASELHQQDYEESEERKIIRSYTLPNYATINPNLIAFVLKSFSAKLKDGYVFCLETAKDLMAALDSQQNIAQWVVIINKKYSGRIGTYKDANEYLAYLKNEAQKVIKKEKEKDDEIEQLKTALQRQKAETAEANRAYADEFQKRKDAEERLKKMVAGVDTRLENQARRLKVGFENERAEAAKILESAQQVHASELGAVKAELASAQNERDDLKQKDEASERENALLKRINEGFREKIEGLKARANLQPAVAFIQKFVETRLGHTPYPIVSQYLIWDHEIDRMYGFKIREPLARKKLIIEMLDQWIGVFGQINDGSDAITTYYNALVGFRNEIIDGRAYENSGVELVEQVFKIYCKNNEKDKSLINLLKEKPALYAQSFTDPAEHLRYTAALYRFLHMSIGESVAELWVVMMEAIEDKSHHAFSKEYEKIRRREKTPEGFAREVVKLILTGNPGLILYRKIQYVFSNLTFTDNHDGYSNFQFDVLNHIFKDIIDKLTWPENLYADGNIFDVNELLEIMKNSSVLSVQNGNLYETDFQKLLMMRVLVTEYTKILKIVRKVEPGKVSAEKIEKVEYLMFAMERICKHMEKSPVANQVVRNGADNQGRVMFTEDTLGAMKKFQIIRAYSVMLVTSKNPDAEKNEIESIHQTVATALAKRCKENPDDEEIKKIMACAAELRYLNTENLLQMGKVLSAFKSELLQLRLGLDNPGRADKMAVLLATGLAVWEEGEFSRMDITFELIAEFLKSEKGQELFPEVTPHYLDNVKGYIKSIAEFMAELRSNANVKQYIASNIVENSAAIFSNESRMKKYLEWCHEYQVKRRLSFSTSLCQAMLISAMPEPQGNRSGFDGKIKILANAMKRANIELLGATDIYDKSPIHKNLTDNNVKKFFEKVEALYPHTTPAERLELLTQIHLSKNKKRSDINHFFMQTVFCRGEDSKVFVHRSKEKFDADVNSALKRNLFALPDDVNEDVKRRLVSEALEDHYQHDIVSHYPLAPDTAEAAKRYRS